jgi:hypothetical protein
MGYFSNASIRDDDDIDGVVFDRRQRQYDNGYDIPDDKVKLKGEQSDGRDNKGYR